MNNDKNKTNIKRIILACLLVSILLFTAFKFSEFPLRSYQLREKAIEKVISSNNNITREKVIIENHQRKNGIAIFAGRVESKNPKFFLVAFESFWISPFYSKAYINQGTKEAKLNLVAKPLDYSIKYSENSDNLIGISKKFNPKYMIIPLLFGFILFRFISLKIKTD